MNAIKLADKVRELNTLNNQIYNDAQSLIWDVKRLSDEDAYRLAINIEHLCRFYGMRFSGLEDLIKRLEEAEPIKDPLFNWFIKFDKAMLDLIINKLKSFIYKPTN